MDKKDKIIIANWKMNLTSKAGQALVADIKTAYKGIKNTQVVICPAFTILPGVSPKLAENDITLGAQDMSWLSEGSLTGEISAKMLKEFNVEYVILGHSERRQHLFESDEIINNKVKAALHENLIPIICVGETFEERQQGRKDFVIAGQVEAALKGVSLNGKFVYIAYEPVWVIGSGQAVNVEEAEHTARIIKQVIIDLYPDLDLKAVMQILYGGSVDSNNVSNFLSSADLSGVLVGGASLKAEEFAKMINAVDNL